MQTIISVDPGSKISGFIIIDGEQIASADNVTNDFLPDMIIDRHNTLIAAGRARPVILIEDIAPYFARLKAEVIDTCKFLGELGYRLKMAGIRPEYAYRTEVKRFAFNSYPEVAIPRIVDKIKARKKLTKAGVPFQPSFVWMDDRIIVACMKEHWGIETPKPGKVNRLGVSKHAWQALALATCYMEKINSVAS